jgi:hypothetical protein
MAGRRPSHFFKIILPSTIHDKKLVMFVLSLGSLWYSNMVGSLASFCKIFNKIANQIAILSI